MGAFGERLKKEREQRNLSLEDISQATKVGVRSLRALEAEDFAKLPGGVFNRGFVRAYARHLGVDEESLIALYLNASGEVLPSQVQEAAPDAGAEEPSQGDGQEFGSGLSLIRLAIGGTILALILLAALWFRHHRASDSAESSTTPKVTYTQPTLAPRSSTSPEPEHPVPPVPSETKPSGPPSLVTPQTVEPNASRKAVIPQPAAQTQSVPPANAGIELSLYALDEVWLSAAIDGHPVREDTLFVNNRRTLRAKEKIVLKVGNAGSLQVSFNGKKLGSLGDDGQVRTLTFLPSGLETPASPSVRAN